MATLTAHTPHLPEHCAHKLPTSCRLTATPKCCACLDKRSHSLSYLKYLDGIGFVSQGTRQERYCWYCKGKAIHHLSIFPSCEHPSVVSFFFTFLYLHRLVFWDARIAASSLRQSDTRLPDVPDQSSFVAEWFDWHRGYKTIPREDGTTEQRSLHRESLSEMPPGRLPRSGDESDNSSAIDNNIQHTSRSLSDLHISTGVGASASPRSLQTLEIDPDDRLFDSPPLLPSSVMDLDPVPPVSAVAAPFSLTPTQSQLQSTSANSNRRIHSSMGHSENHMSESNFPAAGTWSWIRTSSNAPQLQQYQDRAATLLRSRDRLEAVRSGTSQGPRRRAAEEALRRIQLELQGIQQQVAQYQSSVRVFGTREEVERQGADYVSPLTDLFRNASRPATDPANNDTANQSEPPRPTQQIPRRGYSLAPIPAYQGGRVSRNPALSVFHQLSEDREAQRTRENEITGAQGHGHSAIHHGNTTRGRSRRNSRRSGPSPTTTTDLGSNNDEYTSLPIHAQRRTQVPIATSDVEQVPQVIPRRRVHRGSDAFRPPPFVRNTEEDRREWHNLGPDSGDTTLHDYRAAWMYHSDSEGRLYATSNPFAPQPGSGNQQPQQGQESAADLEHFLDDPQLLEALENAEQRRQFERLMHLQLQHHSPERTQPPPHNVRSSIDRTRPPPLTTEQMMVERQCKICWEQLATVATLPCGMSLLFKMM